VLYHIIIITIFNQSIHFSHKMIHSFPSLRDEEILQFSKNGFLLSTFNTFNALDVINNFIVEGDDV